jgi:hypothetical protein
MILFFAMFLARGSFIDGRFLFILYIEGVRASVLTRVFIVSVMMLYYVAIRTLIYRARRVLRLPLRR